MDVSDQRIAFERMFRAHHPAVFRYVLRRVEEPAVQDLVAETFLVAWRRQDEISLRGGPSSGANRGRGRRAAPLRVDLVPAPAAGVYSGEVVLIPTEGCDRFPLGGLLSDRAEREANQATKAALVGMSGAR